MGKRATSKEGLKIAAKTIRYRCRKLGRSEKESQTEQNMESRGETRRCHLKQVTTNKYNCMKSNKNTDDKLYHSTISNTVSQEVDGVSVCRQFIGCNFLCLFRELWRNEDKALENMMCASAWFQFHLSLGLTVSRVHEMGKIIAEKRQGHVSSWSLISVHHPMRKKEKEKRNTLQSHVLLRWKKKGLLTPRRKT